jgi:hypothetical protein
MLLSIRRQTQKHIIFQSLLKDEKEAAAEEDLISNLAVLLYQKTPDLELSLSSLSLL